MELRGQFRPEVVRYAGQRLEGVAQEAPAGQSELASDDVAVTEVVWALGKADGTHSWTRSSSAVGAVSAPLMIFSRSASDMPFSCLTVTSPVIFTSKTCFTGS